eukprot:4372960-Lingulodinium_polyedra.AAC.1
MGRSPRSQRRRWSWRRQSELFQCIAAQRTAAQQQRWRPRPASHHKGWTALPVHCSAKDSCTTAAVEAS